MITLLPLWENVLSDMCPFHRTGLLSHLSASSVG